MSFTAVYRNSETGDVVVMIDGVCIFREPLPFGTKDDSELCKAAFRRANAALKSYKPHAWSERT